jgi:hypothetical protein
MYEFSMTVVIQIDSPSALTALSMTLITSLTQILLVYFVTTIAFPLPLNSNMQIETVHLGRFRVRLGFSNIHIVRSTFADAQTNYHVSEFGH